MRIIFLITVTATLIAGVAFSQTSAEPTDLVTLRDSWERARIAALTPIDKKYEDALSAMRERYTKQGNLPAAVAVDSALSKLKGGSTTATAPDTSATSTDATSAQTTSKQKRLQKELSGSTWACESWKARMTLNEDGTVAYSGDKGSITKWQTTTDGKLALSQGGDFRACDMSKDDKAFRVFFGSWLEWKRQKNK
jgi:hypothetical protein